ncbi:MAG: M48 family metalloprotease [Magnetococcales bacterium]|nr:M48 family metalloprotease [Magnetococcales bacterium]
MKHYHIVLSITLFLVVLLPTEHGQAGFFDQVIQQAVQQHNQGGNQRGTTQPDQSHNSGGNNLINNLGGMLGVSQKNIDLANRGIKTLQAMQPIGEEAEKTLGESISLEAFKRYGGIYDNPSLTRYVTLIGKTIVEVSDRPDLDYHFVVLNSDQQNAFAAPGGYIFVTIGLIKNLRNEAELATILAHEVAHVDRKHMLNTLQRSSLLSNVSELSLTVMNKDPKLLNGAIDQITNLLFTHGIDKDLEHEADFYGVKYAYQAGYSPRAIQDYLKRLQRTHGKASSIFFTTHPPLKDRIKRVNKQINKLPDADRLAILKKRFRRNTRYL